MARKCKMFFMFWQKADGEHALGSNWLHKSNHPIQTVVGLPWRKCPGWEILPLQPAACSCAFSIELNFRRQQEFVDTSECAHIKRPALNPKICETQLIRALEDFWRRCVSWTKCEHLLRPIFCNIDGFTFTYEKTPQSAPRSFRDLSHHNRFQQILWIDA